MRLCHGLEAESPKLPCFLSCSFLLMNAWVCALSGQGIMPGETRITCTACASTLLLEFGLLSRLTGDPVFEMKATIAARQIYSACSPSHFSHTMSLDLQMHMAVFMSV